MSSFHDLLGISVSNPQQLPRKEEVQRHKVALTSISSMTMDFIADSQLLRSAGFGLIPSALFAILPGHIYPMPIPLKVILNIKSTDCPLPQAETSFLLATDL